MCVLPTTIYRRPVIALRCQNPVTDTSLPVTRAYILDVHQDYLHLLTGHETLPTAVFRGALRLSVEHALGVEGVVLQMLISVVSLLLRPGRNERGGPVYRRAYARYGARVEVDQHRRETGSVLWTGRPA